MVKKQGTLLGRWTKQSLSFRGLRSLKKGKRQLGMMTLRAYICVCVCVSLGRPSFQVKNFPFKNLC